MSAKAPALLPANVADWDDDVRSAQSAKVIKEFYNGSGATISKGEVCVVDVLDLNRLGTAIKVSATTADAPIAVGIAKSDIVDGSVGEVIVYGYAPNVLTTGSVTVGSSVQVSATAGAVEDAVSATERRFGFALETDSGTAGDIFVTCLG